MSEVVLIDKKRVREAFSKAAGSYDDCAALQREVADFLLGFSQLTHLSGRVLDVGCGTGYLTAQLMRMGGFKQLIAFDLAESMLQAAKTRLPSQFDPVCGDVEALPFQSACFDLITSSLALQWCRDLPLALAECQRILKPGGRLLFATFGDNTLKELKQAWASVDQFRHVNDFYSADDLVAELSTGAWCIQRQAQHCYQISYPNVWGLLHELKGLGAKSVADGHRQHLTGKARLQQMMAAYSASGEGVIKASYDIIWIEARSPL